MKRLETWGYISLGISFLILGMVIFAHAWIQFALVVSTYGWVQFARSAETVAQAGLALLTDLLLVIILLELFRTIAIFFRTRTISLEPFLHVGIIVAIRRVLAIDAEMALSGHPDPTRFNQALWDVGVHTGVVIALLLGIYLHRSARRTKNH